MCLLPFIMTRINGMFFCNHLVVYPFGNRITCVRVRACVRACPTLCSIAARPVLHQNIVERLVGSTAELIDPHGADPLLAHSALGVPAVDDTVIAQPELMEGGGWAIVRGAVQVLYASQ